MKLLGLLIPQRWIVAFMGFLAFCNSFTLRSCLSMAITQMVMPLNHSKEHPVDETCPDLNHHILKNSTTAVTGGTFEWDEYTQVLKIVNY